MTPTVSKRFNFMDIASCFATEPLPLDFVLPGFPMGTVGGLASPGGVGKSTFILSVAVAIGIPGADANLLGFRLEKHGRVVVLAGEDPANTLHHRMHALGAYLSPAQHSLLSENLHIASCVGMGVDIHDSEWFAQIENLAKNTRLMVIDTLTRFHSLDENNAGDAKKIMSSMESIAARTGCAVLFLHHVNKSAVISGMADLQQAARGSSVFVDNARWLAFVAGMSKAEAITYGIAETDRKLFIRWNVSKQNYAAPRADVWFKRHTGGVLKAIELTDVSKQKASMRRQYD